MQHETKWSDGQQASLSESSVEAEKTETIFSGSKGKLEIYFMFWESIQTKLGGDAFSLETDLAYLQL